MSIFIERLGWVLVHSLWQLALLAIVALAVQRGMRRASATLRYSVLLGALGMMVVAPLVTWPLLPVRVPLPLVTEAPEPDVVPVPTLQPVEVASPSSAVVVSPPEALLAPVVASPPPTVAALPEVPQAAWSDRIQAAVTPWLSTIVWGWSLGVLAFAIRPLWSWMTVRRLQTQGISPVPASVQSALTATAQRLGITQAVRVLQSAVVQVPIVAGYLKPVILLPASIITGMPASQLEAILAHELAHIRRHDYLVNLIQTLVETIFFYHPAVWWLSHQIRCERENCCDDIAVSVLGSRLDYSRALLALEELRATQTPLAIGANGGSLLSRVRRLFHREADQGSLSNGSILLSVTLGVALLAVVTMANSSRLNSDVDYQPGAKVDLPGYGTLEVVAIRNHAGEWWQPDGTSLPADFGAGLGGSLNFRDEASSGRQVGILTRYAGTKALQYSRLRLDAPRTGSFGSWSSETSGQENQPHITDIQFHSDHLTETAVSGDLTVLLSFDSWGPWQIIDLLTPDETRNDGPLSIVVGEIPPSLVSSQCELGLKFKDDAQPAIHFEQMALDQSGNEIPSRGVVGNGGLGLVAYAVPASQVAQLRYRVLRFTHEVHVRKLPLQNGQPTESDISLKVLLEPDEAAAPGFSGPVPTPHSWPQLGGSATHNAVSAVTNLPIQFDLAKQDNIRWTQPIGDFAFSSPVVADGKVLIGTNNAVGRDPRYPMTVDMSCLQCFDERTGEFLWQYSSPKMEQGRRHDWPSIGICSTPVIEGDRVWFATNRCEVVCLDLNGHRDGEDDGPEKEVSVGKIPYVTTHLADVVWKFDLFNTLGVRPLNATCVTPTIAGDLLLTNSSNDVDESYTKLAASEAPAFLAFHKTTGQLVWSDKTPNPNILGNGCSMGAPAVAQIDGTWQAIFAGYDGWIYSFDLAAIHQGQTKLLWKFDLNPKEAQYRIHGNRNEFIYRAIGTTPVVVGDRVYASVGHNPERGEGLGRLWCIDATKRGDISSELVYNKSAPDVVIPHKRIQACEPAKGDFTRPNPHSGVVWVYTTEDISQNGKIEFEEQMHLSNSLPAIHDGLLLTSDLSGLVHCLDVTSGKLLWTHDQLAACWSGPLLADGKAWFIDEDGDLSIFALSKEKKLLAEISMSAPGYTNFAAANETLYLATKTQLVAIGSGKFPETGGVTAKLPGGLEVELVGVTKNAAPPTEGWRVDGSPLESVGDWPVGTTISKDGDRTSISTGGYAKGKTPHPLARDLLFESRGLRSHPSWVILNQKGLTQFESVNADEAIRRRLSYLPNEAGQELSVEMALTDSPWGPWQQIDKSGKRINKIETFEPDQKLYEDIKILRFGPALEGNAQRPLELVLDEPATHNDYQSGVFDITVRFIGTDQKVLSTYAQPKPRQNGRRQVVWRTGGDVPLEKIDHVEFRLRPYRHFITFKNVPLDRTPGAQVAVEHRSLPLPPTHAPDPRFTAQVPGGIEIELLRMVRNDLPEDQSWTPDGKTSPGHLDWPQRSHYKVQPDGNGYTSSNEGSGSDRAWDVAYEVRSAGSKPFVSVDVVGEGSTSSSQFLPAIGPRLVTVLPKVPESLTAFQLRVGTEAWGEWIQVGADGEILNPEAVRTENDSPDRLVSLVRAGLDTENLDRSWLQWRTPQNHAQHYQMEVRAIDDDGKVTESNSSTHSVADRTHVGITKYFNLPLDRLARFEYRLRPYRHLVTFDHICTDPAKPTEVRVDVTPIVYLEVFPSPEAAVKPARPLVAMLPGGLEVELVGVTKNFAPSKEGWKPDGSPIGEVADWQATRVFRREGDSTVFDSKGTPHPDARDYLFEMRGFRSPPSYETNLNDTTSWNEPEYAEPYRTRLSMLLKESNDAKKFSIKITDDPWGPYQQVGPDGALLNELNLTELEKKYYDKIRVEHCGPDPANLGEGELSLQFQGSFMLDEKDWGYDFEVRAIGLDGQPLKDAYPWNSSRILNKTTLQYLTPDHLPAGKIARWEYRLRPYRHLITFENVSFEPGTKSEPKVSVESIEVAKTEEEPVAKSPTPEAQPQPRIDLIGLTYDSVPKKETWNPNGQPLPAPEWVQQLPKLYGDDKSQPAPLYLFEVHGLRAKPSFRHRYQPAVVSGDDEVPEGRPYRMAVLYEDLKPEERNQFIIWGEHPAVRLSDEPWGPWRTITKEGQFAEPVAPNTLYHEGYDMVTLHGFRPLTKKPDDPEPAADAVRTGLVLKHPQDYDALYAIEIEAVPSTAGPQLVNVFTSRPVKLIRHTADDWWDIESEWPVDPTKIDHIRYRIRPYRHRFEFQEVAYKQYERPATSAPFKVIHTKLEHDLPKPVAVSRVQATLPGGLELELLGVTPFREPDKENWAPDGKKFEPAPDWASRFKLEPLPPGGMSDWVNEDYRDFIVRARGFSPEQLALLPFAERFESGDSTIGRMQVLTWNQQVQRLRIGIPGEWGPYRVLTVDPKLPPKAKAVEVPAEVPAPLRKVYDSIQPRLEASDARLERWQKRRMESLPPDFRPGDPDPDFEAGDKTRVVWKGQPTNQDLKYTDIGAVVIDLEGKRHPVSWTSSVTELEGGQQWHVDIFNVPLAQVSHVEYRLRPYQHVVTFNNVALHVGADCGPNVVVESPLAMVDAAVGATEHAKPHFDLQVVDDVTQQPISGADVRVRYFVNSWQPNKVTPPKIVDVNSQFHTDAQAVFPIAFPDEMQGLMLNLKISVWHSDYVIEQSFGAWQVTAEMAANPTLFKEKLFSKGVISLKPGVEVSGQVLAPDGTPAKDVPVYAAWQMPEYLNMPPHAMTDAEGRYKFRVGGFESTYLFIMPTDAVALSIPIQKQYGEHPVVKLEAGTVITGRVLDEKGDPLENVVVQGNGNDTVYTGFPNPMVRVATDAKGRYKLPPLKLPVDVRVGRFGYLGGWSKSGTSPEGAYLPVMLLAPGADASGSSAAQPSALNTRPLVLDFRPVETVTLIARAYREGNPTDNENIELFGVVPDPKDTDDQRGPRWRGSFRSVPGQIGVYQLKAPQGLVNATIDLTQSGSNRSQNHWTRAVRDGEKLEGPRTNAGWTVLDRDDDSIVIGTSD